MAKTKTTKLLNIATFDEYTASLIEENNQLKQEISTLKYLARENTERQTDMWRQIQELKQLEKKIVTLQKNGSSGSEAKKHQGEVKKYQELINALLVKNAGLKQEVASLKKSCNS